MVVDLFEDSCQKQPTLMLRLNDESESGDGATAADVRWSVNMEVAHGPCPETSAHLHLQDFDTSAKWFGWR